jgi:hypothetical protein
MAEVREITEFYSRKGRKGLQVWYLRGGIFSVCRKKNGEKFCFKNITLNLVVGSKPASPSISNSLGKGCVWEEWGESGQIHANTYLNFR